MVRATTRKPRTKPLFGIDGHFFSSRLLFNLYKKCLEAQKNGLVTTFEIKEVVSQKTKFHTFHPMINDITFDSALEADFYVKLLFDVKNGIIESFKRQVPYVIQPRFVKNGRTFRPITYISDFDVIDKGGNKIVFDTKGKETPEFKLKQKMFEYKYPDLSLKVIAKYEPTGEWLELKDIRKLKRAAKKERESKKKE